MKLAALFNIDGNACVLNYIESDTKKCQNRIRAKFESRLKEWKRNNTKMGVYEMENCQLFPYGANMSTRRKILEEMCEKLDPKSVLRVSSINEIYAIDLNPMTEEQLAHVLSYCGKNSYEIIEVPIE